MCPRNREKECFGPVDRDVIVLLADGAGTVTRFFRGEERMATHEKPGHKRRATADQQLQSGTWTEPGSLKKETRPACGHDLGGNNEIGSAHSFHVGSSSFASGNTFCGRYAKPCAMPSPAAKTLFPLPRTLSGPGPAGVGSGNDSQGRDRGLKSQDYSTPKVELFVGYTYWWAVPGHADNRIAEMNGASASLAYNFNRYLGLAVDVGGFKVDSLKFSSLGAGSTPTRVVDADSNVLTFLIGPRLSFRSHSRLTPFLQVLGGAALADTVTVTGCTAQIYVCIPLPRETAFAMTAGCGLDLRLNHRIAWRVLQAEFLLTRFDDPTSAT